MTYPNLDRLAVLPKVIRAMNTIYYQAGRFINIRAMYMLKRIKKTEVRM